jgi:hypothetical protein
LGGTTRTASAPAVVSHFCDGCQYGGSGNHHYKPRPRHHGRICDGCPTLPRVKAPVVRAPKYDPYKCMFFTSGACETLHRQGSGGHRRSGAPARVAATVFRAGPTGQAFDLVSHLTGKTVGVCVNGDAVAGYNATGGFCYVSTPSGEAGFTATAGGGLGASIGGSVTIGFTGSNARNMSDLAKQFAYVWGSAGEGIGATGSLQWGQNGEGRTIRQGTLGASLVGPRPTPFSYGGGVSYTWIAPSYR